MTESREDPRHAWLNGRIDEAAEGLEMYSAESYVQSLKPMAVRELRRAGGPRKRDNLGTVTLVEQDGVLRWVDGLGFHQRAQGGRRRGGPHRAGNIIKQLKFERLDQNSIGAALQRLDGKLNANSGIRAWSSLTNGTAAAPVKKGRILLIVHGTFSKTETITNSINATKEGRQFFARARKKYSQILSFDHPTLSVSPVLNAIDLSRHLAATDAEIDVLCHSRGGLVARWWVEALVRNPHRIGKVIFVGAPLAGTSLAAPPRLRAGLDLLTNVAEVLGKGSELASSVLPLFVAVTGILKVFGSVTRVVAQTPLIDATVFMIPGLAAQSMTGDNSGIVKLREAVDPSLRSAYFAVATDFEPNTPGWAFWRYFQKPILRLADVGADMVFEGANDLVVDTASMSELSDKLQIPQMNIMPALPRRDVMHHLNYFQQPEVLKFLEKVLALP